MENQADEPTYAQIDFFRKAMNGHDKVELIESINEQIYRISRTDDLHDITVYLTNLYTVGSADIIDITSRHPEVNCIVTMSNWNHYTKDAKSHASERKIGLFFLSEFMGALNWTLFWKYKKRRGIA